MALTEARRRCAYCRAELVRRDWEKPGYFYSRQHCDRACAAKARSRSGPRCRLPADRAMDKFIPEPNSGCWLWIGALDDNGYGRVYTGRTHQSAHVVLYRALRGKIPAGMELDHKCRVPCCVNPDHMEPVTHQENVMRGKAGRLRIRKPLCLRGHEFTPDNTRYTTHGQRVCRACQNYHQRLYQKRRREKCRAV